MATTTIPKNKEKRMARILAEAEQRYRHELLGHDERELLDDRIKRLRFRLRKLGA